MCHFNSEFDAAKRFEAMVSLGLLAAYFGSNIKSRFAQNNRQARESSSFGLRFTQAR